jgi:hypothetical protein
MLSYLMSLAGRLGWRNFGGLPDHPSEDPYADVREPRRRGPGGKSTAVAVVEPAEPLVTDCRLRTVSSQRVYPSAESNHG